MKKDNWIFALIAVLLLLTLIHGANAQNERTKNKYNVKVELMGKRQVSGVLIETSQDSLIIMETKGIVVGSQVKVYLTHDYFLSGEIVGISDSTVVLKTEADATGQVLRFARIKEIVTRSYPSGFNKNAPVRTSIPVSQISKIKFAEKGSGTIGFFVGGLTAAALGYGIGLATYSEEAYGGPELKGSALAVLAFPIGGLMGSAIAREGRTYKINGDAVSYNRFLSKVK